MNFGSIKHWLTVLGLPTLAALLENFMNSGGSLAPTELSSDLHVALMVFVATVIGLIQPNADQQKEVARLNAKLVEHLSKLSTLILLVLACRGCSAAQDVQGIATGVNIALCIEQTVSTDEAAGKSWEQAVLNSVAKCGADASTVANVWAAHTAAEVREGFVPKMMVPNMDSGVWQ
jgi:hypothetical protein